MSREILRIIKLLSLFSEQKKSSEKITLVAGDKIFTQHAKYAKFLNAVASNLVKNLKIPGFDKVNSFAEEISRAVLEAFLKT